MNGVEMGQATVDLPDPLEPRAPSAASTDELLAQLAGEEIDRLLADADSELPGDAKQGSAPPSTVDAPKTSQVGENEAAGNAASGSAAANLSAELDDLFAQLNVGGATPAEAGAAKITAVPGVEPALAPSRSVDKSESESVSRRPAVAETASAAEREALVAPNISDAESAAAMASASPPGQPDERAPFYLRLLEWINSPLARCPDPVRDAIGKIAILTAVNAILILAYLLFLRKR